MFRGSWCPLFFFSKNSPSFFSQSAKLSQLYPDWIFKRHSSSHLQRTIKNIISIIQLQRLSYIIHTQKKWEAEHKFVHGNLEHLQRNVLKLSWLYIPQEVSFSSIYCGAFGFWKVIFLNLCVWWMELIPQFKDRFFAWDCLRRIF